MERLATAAPIGNAHPRVYTFTMHRHGMFFAAAALAALILAPHASAGTNLLRNSGFEQNFFGNDALATNWNYHGAWTHGGYWGTAARRNWGSHSGSWAGAIQGSWAGGTDGGFWQQAPGEPGLEYEVSGYFYADNGTPPGGFFTAAVEALQIEFANANSSVMDAYTVLSNLASVGEAWEYRNLRAVAPTGTAYVRFVFRASGVGSSGSIQGDDASLVAMDKYDQNFNLFVNHPTDTCFTQQTWVVCTGRTVSTIARSGYAADLPNHAGTTDNVNAVISPAYTAGIGTVTFYYRHGHMDTLTAPTNPVNLNVEASTDGTNWSSVGTVTNILATNYLQFQQFLNLPSHRHLRIRHAGGSTNRLLIDDITIAKPTTLRSYMDFNDWTGAGTNSFYTFAGWQIETGSVLSANAFNGQAAFIVGGTAGGNYLRSPLLSNGLGALTFTYRAHTNTSSIGYVIETSTTGTNWIPLYAVSNISNTAYDDAYHYIYMTNAAYVRVRHAGGSTTNALLIDNIDVAAPIIYRSQNFDGWPTESSYGFHTYQGWQVEDGRIVTNAAYFGKSVIMEDTVASNALVRSPLIPDGIGPISFRYVLDQTNAVTNAYLSLQTSGNGTNWSLLDSVGPITNKTYQQYSKFFSMSSQLYVRIVHTSGVIRISVDEVVLNPLQPPADVVLTAYNTPETPYTNDAVSLNVNYQVLNSASILAMTSYYRVGTSGAFTAVGMSYLNGVTYISTSTIPAQPAGTVVQYYMQCHFNGYGSETNSPKNVPTGGSTNPASYRVPRNQPGTIWINELNYLNDLSLDTNGLPVTDTNEFVELAGPAGSDISGWRLDFAVSLTYSPSNPYSIYASYTVPDGTVLSNSANGYGFFTLGDVEMAAIVNQTFMHTNDIDLSQISDGFYPSGVLLVNEGGGTEQSLCYDGYLIQFEVIGREPYETYQDPYSLQSQGTGSTYNAFSTGTNIMTPGAINVGQAFPFTGSSNDGPVAYFVRMTVGTNVNFWTYGNTNNWAALPYVATNITGTQQWLPVTPFNSSYAGGTNRIWFDKPTGTTTYYYRVIFTNAP
jgi:hypothetical protein